MRERYVLKNFITKVLSMLIYTVLNLISKRVFVSGLGDTTMGLNALLLSILSMLSLLELGIGDAIYFSLYKPLAENNFEQTNAIMCLYAKIYKIIGALVMVVGMALLPFLHFFVDTELSDWALYGAYAILLLDTSLSYYMAYRRNIFNADQKQYFNTDVSMVVNTVVSCLQMFAVVMTGNYFLFLVIRVVGTFVANWYIYYQSGKRYPYLKEKTDYFLSKEFMDTFKNNVKALCLLKVSSYLVYGTDNLLLSAFTDLATVFIYSNYAGILTIVNQIFHTLFDSMQASIGNFMVLEGKEKSYGLFKNIFFLNFLITSYTSVALMTLFNDAMTLWMGEKYIWPMAVVAVLVFNNYSRYILRAADTFKNAAGIYSPFPAFKYLSLLEGAVNIVASLFFILVCDLGVLGVFLGTSVSSIVSTFVIPYAIYKYYFGHGHRDYINKYLQYMLLTVAYSLLSVVMYQYFHSGFIFRDLALGLVLSFMIPVGFSSLLYHRTEEFQYVKETMLKYIGKLLKGNRNSCL